MKIKKLLMFSLIVFILAGIIVVLFKGFNIDLQLRSHDTIEYVVGKDFEIKKIEEISKEIFVGKPVVVRVIEVFDDAVSIKSSQITEEEKNNLIVKLNENFGTDYSSEDIKIITNPGLRLRQIIKPYILPSLISFLLIYIFYIIRFIKNIGKEVFLKSIGLLLLMNLAIFSFIAISRLYINTITIPIVLFIDLFALILFFENKNNNITKLKQEK